MRKNIVAGNWKMNTTLNQGKELVKDIIKNVTQISYDVTLIIAPPFTHLAGLSKLMYNTGIFLSAQNVADNESGAFTGEVSASMIKSTGAQYTIIGHSERRKYYDETDEIILEKILLSLQNDLSPIVCCGELLDDRENNKHFEIVKKQIENSVLKISREEFDRIIIAYEPVWAIGTGKTASPEQAQEMHAYIRSLIQNYFDEQVADELSILYGGSCKPSNAKELFKQQDVDGGLIGGASLKANDFIEIAKAF